MAGCFHDTPNRRYGRSHAGVMSGLVPFIEPTRLRDEGTHFSKHGVFSFNRIGTVLPVSVVSRRQIFSFQRHQKDETSPRHSGWNRQVNPFLSEQGSLTTCFNRSRWLSIRLFISRTTFLPGTSRSGNFTRNKLEQALQVNACFECSTSYCSSFFSPRTPHSGTRWAGTREPN